PSIGVVVGYGTAFYCLGLTLKTIPFGTAYAIWAGLGTALSAIVGVVLHKEIFNRKKVLGILCIIVGVVVLNLAGGH
ncbi:multidrug efflux SMR transporter, partial [Lysinibacillus sp. D4B1_S16]|uniref:DMT family transporter n=1 Tax=Lysinibacillus sp. D4B1_S16 TaxID=2941231 RepID=UPI0020C03B52